MSDEDKQMAVWKHLYEELRHFRLKEFQTFAFAFPIVAAGFLPAMKSIPGLLLLVTGFGFAMIHYICKNHYRMMRMKEQIVALQCSLGINQYFGGLKPEEWSKKGFRSHLGMLTYVVILIAQLAILWRDIISKAIDQASKHQSVGANLLP